MNKVILGVIIIIAVLVPLSSAIPFASSPSEDSQDVATNLSQWLVDLVSRKILAILRLLNLKTRIVRFLTSLYTTENIELLRTLLDYGVKIGSTALRWLPASAEPNALFENLFRRFIEFNVGGFQSMTGENIVEEASEISENVVNPPIMFHEPVANNETKNEVTMDLSNQKTKRDNHGQNDLLRTYEERVMSLDKLINAGGRYTT